MTLFEKAPGETVVIGDRQLQFIVLGHLDNGTAVITKNIGHRMSFGESADYETSDVRRYCTVDFLDVLSQEVGINNIVPHVVPLMAEDGTNDSQYVTDLVSVLTTNRYRSYRRYLPRTGTWWWLANRVSMEREYSRSVCCVNDNGTVGWVVCGYDFGVRPFCILESSILVPD